MQKKQITIKELAEMIDVPYIEASSLMKLLERVEAAVPVGTRPNIGRGKPSLLYEVDQEITLELWQNDVDKESHSDFSKIEIPEIKIDKSNVSV